MTDGLTNGLWAGDPDEPIHDLLTMKHSATITQLLAFAQISLPLSLIASFQLYFIVIFLLPFKKKLSEISSNLFTHGLI